MAGKLPHTWDVSLQSNYASFLCVHTRKCEGEGLAVMNRTHSPARLRCIRVYRLTIESQGNQFRDAAARIFWHTCCFQYPRSCFSELSTKSQRADAQIAITIYRWIETACYLVVRFAYFAVLLFFNLSLFLFLIHELRDSSSVDIRQTDASTEYLKDNPFLLLFFAFYFLFLCFLSRVASNAEVAIWRSVRPHYVASIVRDRRRKSNGNDVTRREVSRWCCNKINWTGYRLRLPAVAVRAYGAHRSINVAATAATRFPCASTIPPIQQ